MEGLDLEAISELFGISIATTGTLSGIGLLLTAALKDMFKVIDGKYTKFASLGFALLASAAVYQPDITAIITSALLVWLLPAGAYQIVKRASGTQSDGSNSLK